MSLTDVKMSHMDNPYQAGKSSLPCSDLSPTRLSLEALPRTVFLNTAGEVNS